LNEPVIPYQTQVIPSSPNPHGKVIALTAKVSGGLFEGIPVSGLLFPGAAGQRRRGIALGGTQDVFRE
jgi:hypothetical protein